MKTKVKISCSAKNLEYLVMVLKINTKGLLINHLVQLRPQDVLDLEIRVPGYLHAVKVRGVVHKVLAHPNGHKGTIVRFDRLSPQQINKLKTLILSSEAPDSYASSVPQAPLDAPVEPTPPMPMAVVDPVDTIMDPYGSLSHLALESPDREPNFVPSTVDEEAFLFRQGQEGLAGKTIIGHHLAGPLPKIKKPSRVTKLLRVVSLLFLFIFTFLWLQNKTFELPDFAFLKAPQGVLAPELEPTALPPTSTPRAGRPSCPQDRTAPVRSR